VGLIGINVREGDELIDVQITGGDNEVILATRNGIAIRFRESDARVMGRVAEGVRGIRLSEGDEVVGMVVVVRDQATLLVVSERGMGKRTEIDAYRLQKRGGKGVINLKTNEKTGKVIAIKSVVPEDQLMLITRNGVINRQRVDEIRVIGRATQGVRLVNLDKNDRVMDVASVFPEDPTNGSTEFDGSVDGEGPDAEGPDAEGPDTAGVDADGLEGEGADDGESAEASVDADTGDVAEMDSDTEGE
jgi:DNA gyrase subunit A